MTATRALLGGAVAVVLAATLVAPWAVGPASATTTLPRPGSVVAGRYVGTVRLDDGTLTVTPPPSGARPTVSRAAAQTEFTADAQLSGYHRVAFGYGVVSVSAHGHGTTPITRLPAWIGFARTVAVYHCPAQTGSEPPPGSPPLSNGYAAVVIGAAHGAPAVTYVARSERCTALVPTAVSPASEEVSVPWHAAGPLENGAIEAVTSLPPCGSFSTISAGGTASAVTVTLAALVPDQRRHCHGRTTVTEKVVLNPLGGTGTAIRHGRLGPETEVRPG
jgi:hypothetical protein